MSDYQYQFETVARHICSTLGLQFLSVVGRGAFKETFEVADGHVSYALKVFRPTAVKFERIDREVAAMLQCDHPNIGRLLRLDRQRVDGAEYVYSIEEFVGGGTLSDLVITRGLLNVEQAKAIGASLVSAVSHIAARGLVHRDIKPENIMLREDTVTPVLVDFGLVRLLNEPSITVSWAERGPGTPYFASPEQLRNEKHLIDWRADQFSLGVTLACVILGRHPYAMSVDEDMAATVDRVADREHVPTAFVDDVAKFGLPVLARMVSPWPVNRYREPTVLVEAWAKQ